MRFLGQIHKYISTRYYGSYTSTPTPSFTPKPSGPLCIYGCSHIRCLRQYSLLSSALHGIYRACLGTPIFNSLLYISICTGAVLSCEATTRDLVAYAIMRGHYTGSGGICYHAGPLHGHGIWWHKLSCGATTRTRDLVAYAIMQGHYMGSGGICWIACRAEATPPHSTQGR